MRILAIETSCDETSAAVVEKKENEQTIRVLSNVTATSLAIHATTGGIIPENAAREQVKFIIPTIKKALVDANVLINDVDSLAVTYGPGLIGSLLVGVETAKTLSFAFNKPIVPVNHLLAHLFANFIESPKSKNRNTNILFPFIGLIVSGGHTDLLLFESLTKYKWLGGTRDDAAGEALDKIGRLLNLSYPAGPEIEKRAKQYSNSVSSKERDRLRFQSPMLGSKDFDFSFSGLKAEIARFISDKNLTEELINQICCSLQNAIFNVLVKKTVRAAKLYECSKILLGGGVSANQTLKEEFEHEIRKDRQGIEVFVPEKMYSTDNAAMIGAYATLNFKPSDWHQVTAQPELYFK